ncbi:flagellar basal body L-ring protein FlgH [uncultured Paludibaculum sp.]|uniref:flagellar basal body L-ring protein FlgH n=1 Tax=uncultured Paludibaculum sp. TaxID=1765020 RepID=UPI002AAAAE28|nr:flagellar basal body L-ring protein FlgH [uncultured Paludibaculum sp.]
MKTAIVWGLAMVLFAAGAPAKDKKKAAQQVPSEIDKYRDEVQRSQKAMETQPGSLWTPTARLLDAGADLRASHAGDIVTVLVQEDASAVAKGTTKTSRSSSVKAGVTSVAGISTPALAGLAQAGTDHSLNGDGTTSRENSLRATLTARVSEVLPNGNMIIEGSKSITVNSETQVVTLRGVARPFDISTGNIIQSDHLGLLEIKVNGKGVVNDVIRRPNFIYRLLLGILPF